MRHPGKTRRTQLSVRHARQLRPRVCMLSPPDSSDSKPPRHCLRAALQGLWRQAGGNRCRGAWKLHRRSETRLSASATHEATNSRGVPSTPGVTSSPTERPPLRVHLGRVAWVSEVSCLRSPTPNLSWADGSSRASPRPTLRRRMPKRLAFGGRCVANTVRNATQTSLCSWHSDDTAHCATRSRMRSPSRSCVFCFPRALRGPHC